MTVNQNRWDGWISVNERQPTEDGWYAVLKCWDSEEGYFPDAFWFQDGRWYTPAPISHWRGPAFPAKLPDSILAARNLAYEHDIDRE